MRLLIPLILERREVKLRNGFLLLVVLFAGCAWHVAFKMPVTYRHETAVPLKAAFYMSEILKDRMYYGRAESSGIDNRWDAPIGDAVYMYAVAYLSKGFANFSEIDSLEKKTAYDLLVKMDEINYYMEGRAAHCDLTFAIEVSSGKEVYRKKYHADGPSGFGTVLGFGAFEQKSAIRQSTHVVMENIFKALMNDIRANYNSWGL